MFGYSDDENGKYTRKSMMATGKYKSTSTQISNMVSLNFGSFTFCAGELIELGLRALKRFYNFHCTGYIQFQCLILLDGLGEKQYLGENCFLVLIYCCWED